ncbi:hypothetical protein F511_42472 [Dorcoceras hygrometricum]|uniref:Uncharacterized protein n=1 Tax=Dorcoceras hygrometricum TaxID=472368 RepID=A0A2Z7CIE6_9LAMI|nr:hypothetical protein F511_42472 [Dorcoceras hygrometricum]
MSTAELNSNDEKDKKPAKEKDTSTVPLSVLYRTLLNGKNLVSNGIYCTEAIYAKATPLKEVDEWTKLVGDNQSAVAKVNRTVHQQRENESGVKLSITIRERALLQFTVELELAC